MFRRSGHRPGLRNGDGIHALFVAKTSFERRERDAGRDDHLFGVSDVFRGGYLVAMFGDRGRVGVRDYCQGVWGDDGE